MPGEEKAGMPGFPVRPPSVPSRLSPVQSWRHWSQILDRIRKRCLTWIEESTVLPPPPLPIGIGLKRKMHFSIFAIFRNFRESSKHSYFLQNFIETLLTLSVFTKIIKFLTITAKNLFHARVFALVLGIFLRTFSGKQIVSRKSAKISCHLNKSQHLLVLVNIFAKIFTKIIVKVFTIFVCFRKQFSLKCENETFRFKSKIRSDRIEDSYMTGRPRNSYFGGLETQWEEMRLTFFL